MSGKCQRKIVRVNPRCEYEKRGRESERERERERDRETETKTETETETERMAVGGNDRSSKATS